MAYDPVVVGGGGHNTSVSLEILFNNCWVEVWKWWCKQPGTVTFVDTVGTTMSFTMVGLPFAKYQGFLQEIHCWLTNGSHGVNTSTTLARRGNIDLVCLGRIPTFSHKIAQLNELNMRIHDS